MRVPFLIALAAALLACGGSPEDVAYLDASDCPAASPIGMGRAPASRVLLNAYYLQEEAARCLRQGQQECPVVEEVFAKASAMGVFGVRTNAYNDAPDKIGDSTIQLAPGQYDETAFRALDLVLARAAVHGVKLVLPLGNYWDAYGGARRYVEWAGLSDPQEGDPRFFTDPKVIALYTQHLADVLDRVNTVDGIRYGDHPAVWAWELLNEPRGRGLDKDGQQLRAWIDTVAKVVRQHAPAHLIGTGEEGFESSFDEYDADYWRRVAPDLFRASGQSFRRDLASPWIDFGTVHLYPEAWKVDPGEVPRMGARWIRDHAALAHALGKPLFLGEFGLRNEEGLPLEVRRDAYRGWFDCAKRSGVGASAPWLFAYDARPDDWDGYDFYFKDGTQPSDPVNRYADVVIGATAP